MAGRIERYDLISKEAIDELTNVLTRFESLIKSATELSKSLKGSGDGLKKHADYSKEAAKLTQELVREQKALVDLENKVIDQLKKKQQLEQQEERTKQTKLRTAKAEEQQSQRITAQERQQAAMKKLLIQARQTEEGSLSRLNALNNIYKQRMKELNVLIPAQAKTYEFLNQKIIMNQQAMSKMAMGAQKGGKQFNMLQWQIMQVSREMPAFAYGINVGIGALSNNLPMLADEISNVRKQNALLIAQGKPTTSVLKQIATSIFSWQTALIAIVTLLTLYGKEISEWVKGLFNAKKNTDLLIDSSKQLSEAFKKGSIDAQEEKTKLDILYKATQDTTKSTEERKSAIGELQKLYPEYFGNLSKESILAGDAYTAYTLLNDSIENRARSMAVFTQMVANNVKGIEKEIEANKLYSLILQKEDERSKLREKKAKGGFSSAKEIDKTIDGINNLNEEINNLRNQWGRVNNDVIQYRNANEELSKFVKTSDLFGGTKGDGDQKDDILQRRKAEMDLILAQNEAIIVAAKNSGILTEAQKAEIEHLELKKKLLYVLTEFTKKGSKEELELLKEIQETDNDIADKRFEYKTEIDKKYSDSLEKTSKDWAEKRKAQDEQTIADLYAGINEQRVIMAEAATQQLKEAGNTAKKRREINNALALAQIQFEREQLERIYKSGVLQVEMQKWVKNQIEKLTEDEENFKRKSNEETTKQQEENLQYLGQAVSNGASLYSEILEGQLARAKQIYEADAAAAGDSAEKKYLAELKYQEEQRKIKRRQAIADKAQALFNIGLQLAMAEAELNPFQIAAAILAAATVIAKPIPEFATGTEFAPETFIAGEKGTEAIVKKTGETLLTPNKATMFSDKSFIGAKIIPNDETQKLLANQALRQSANIVDMGRTNKHLSNIERNTKRDKEIFTRNGKVMMKRGIVTSVIS
jgi:hypothetical protein